MELVFKQFREFKKDISLVLHEVIVEDFLYRKDFMLLHAPAKAGKSMFALNLALAVATGKDFLGMPVVSKSKVLYLQTEIVDHMLDERIENMAETHNEEFYSDFASNLFISNNRIRIDEKIGIELLKKQISTHSPALLIIDPLYELHRKNEDSSSDMAPLLSDIREVARSCNCAVILIHHQGKKGENSSHVNVAHGCRGSSTFGDVPDSIVSLIKDKNGLTLKGTFRNRMQFDDLRLNFNASNCWFELDAGSSAPVKTKDLILNVLKLSSAPLSKNEIFEKINAIATVSVDAVQKHLYNLAGQKIIEKDGTSKEAKYFINGGVFTS